jgi:FixJ family two-component response regulator
MRDLMIVADNSPGLSFSDPASARKNLQGAGCGCHCKIATMNAKHIQRSAEMVQSPLVSIVDDDESVRESLPDLVREFGYEAQAFSTAEEFLASNWVDQTKCLILDIAMPGMSGTDLKQALERHGRLIPTIFITARGDDGVRSRLLEQGAVECLFKPFSDTALLEALNSAFQVH